MLYLFLENETSAKFTETEEIAQIHRKIFLSRTLKRLTKNATTTLAACSLLHAREHNDPTMSSTNSSLSFSYNLDLTPFTQSNLQFKKLYLVLLMRHAVSVCLYVCALLVSLIHYAKDEIVRRDEIAWHHTAFILSYCFPAYYWTLVRLFIHLIKEAEMQ